MTGAPAEQPVRSRGAFGDELRTPAPRANKQGGWPEPEPPDADPTERERTERSPAGLPEVLTSLADEGELSADAQRRLLDAARCDAARFETLARECVGAHARGVLALESDRHSALADGLATTGPPPIS